LLSRRLANSGTIGSRKGPGVFTPQGGCKSSPKAPKMGGAGCQPLRRQEGEASLSQPGNSRKEPVGMSTSRLIQAAT
jgi:hypothetical protein